MLGILGSLKKTNPATSVVSNSLRFRANAGAYLSRTFVTPTNSTIYTWSAWVKRGALGGTYRLFGASTTTYLTFNTSDQLNLTLGGTSAATSTAVFRDPASWYHIVYTQNGSAQTIYVNGTSVATGTTANTVFNTAIAHQLCAANTTSYFDGYLTEVNFIDGQALTPSSFGQISSTTGVWSPKAYTGTYGTNGFYLKFADASAATAAAIGKDSSGNGNNWTPTNISVTLGTSYDSMIDVPVSNIDGNNNRGNYCVWNPLDKITTASVVAGNLETTSAISQNVIGTISMDSGSWYWEILYSAATSSQIIGVYKTSAITATITPTASVIGIKFNADTGALDYTVNGSTYTSIATGLTGGGYLPYAGSLTNAKVIYANFGQRPFTYTPPFGFLALNAQNIPTPTIVNSAFVIATTLYTGTGAALNISNTNNGVSFQPDLVWIKSRTGATDHAWYDVVRGTTKDLASNSTAIETTQATGLTSFNTDGFGIGALAKLNTAAATYIAWQWKAGGAPISNTAGTISSQVSVNQAAGFSIVSYTGNNVSGATVGHGLSVAPAFIIVRNRTFAADWSIYHAGLTAGNTFWLDLSSPSQSVSSTGQGGISSVSSTVFTCTNGTTNGNTVNGSGNPMIAYCFAQIIGFSRFYYYTGNGLADGPFVYCGFLPKFLMIKSMSTGNWEIVDTTRSTSNTASIAIQANSNSAESNSVLIDVLSNGFKIRSATFVNSNGTFYIFCAFAENPMKYALAR